MKAETKQVQVNRWSMISSRSFDEIISVLNAAIGHQDMKTFFPAVEAGSPAEMKAVIEKATGPSGFMEFMHFDHGKIVAKETKGSPRIQRFVIGNPLIMKEMVKHVPDAGSYAPVTILIVEETNSVRISYDTMESLLAPYGSAEASAVARDLDKKVELLITEMAREC